MELEAIKIADSSQGSIVFSAIKRVSTHMFYNSFEVLEDTTAPALAPSNRELWIGAMNDAGGVTDLIWGHICGARMGGQTDPSLIDPIISTMNTAFGRSLF
jgi:hypothetical protein